MLQVGWALQTRHVVTKCPNNYGVNTLVLDPTGLQASPGLPIPGSLLVQLGMAMGVYDAATIVNTPYGGLMKPNPHTKEWCDSAQPAAGPTPLVSVNPAMQCAAGVCVDATSPMHSLLPSYYS